MFELHRMKHCSMNLILASCLMLVCGLASADSQKNPIRLATTTSTVNSGLLDVLMPVFEKDSGYPVHVIAVGTGKALRMGRDGDVDVMLVHAPAAEKVFVQQGYGVKRHPIMVNDFIIVGPANDPSEISELALKKALNALSHHKNTFISRGDDSGTHKKERHLWQEAGITPEGIWYREAGQGMGKVLQMASELQAYTLTDRGTWLAMRNKLDLTLFVEGDESLRNPYGMIAVNPQNYPDTHQLGAKALIEWMRSAKAQQMIADFKIDGQTLFKPLRASK
jgi:tungstate transport system substrate-binding protein